MRLGIENLAERQGFEPWRVVLCNADEAYHAALLLAALQAAPFNHLGTSPNFGTLYFCVVSHC